MAQDFFFLVGSVGQVSSNSCKTTNEVVNGFLFLMIFVRCRAALVGNPSYFQGFFFIGCLGPFITLRDFFHDERFSRS